MGVRILSVRRTRAIARQVGEPVLRAWGNGHPSLFTFVTPDHRHGWIDERGGTFAIHLPVGQPGGVRACTTSCDRLFSGQPCPGCGHEDHGETVECTRRVDTDLRGKCFHREDPCPDPDLHQREDLVTRPCRCPLVLVRTG